MASAGFAGGGKKTTTLRGEVTDKSGEPLAGVQIKLKDSGKTFYTDFEGKFELDQVTIADHQLEISYISYETKKVQLDQKQFNSAPLHLELSSK